MLRREAAQLPAFVERVRELMQPGDSFRSSGHGGLLRTAEGRVLELAGVKDEGDKTKWQGRAHDLKLWDEISECSESQYVFVNAWNRTTLPDQRCRIVGAGNPPTNAEGEWVLRRWAPWLDRSHPRPAAPGELRWFGTLPSGAVVECEDGRAFIQGGQEVRPRSRTFVPARLEDNPALMRTDYAAVLASLPEPLRSQMRYGDFSAGREDDAWQVIPTAWVMAAMARWEKDRDERGGTGTADHGPLTHLGVDVARGGKCQTVLAPRHGNWFAPLHKHKGKDTADGPTVAGLVLMALGQHPGARVHIDSIGVGASAYDSLKAVTSYRLHLWGVVSSESSDRTDRSGKLRFRNVRAECWWLFREALDPVKGDGLMLPPDRELLADLTAPRWKMTASGVLIESKEELEKRLGRSPDVGDSVVYAAHPGRTLARGAWGMARADQ